MCYKFMINIYVAYANYWRFQLKPQKTRCQCMVSHYKDGNGYLRANTLKSRDH